MDGLVLAVAMAFAYALTNGFHDAANAIAALVATRAARPGPAIALAAVANLAGPLLVGTAVADTIAGVVQVAPDEMVAVVGAGLTGAVVWNLVTWRFGLPSSSSHALVGGLVGAAVWTAGWGAVEWGGMDGIHPVGVIGILVALLVSPVFGLVAGAVLDRLARRALRRGTHRVDRAVRRSEWLTSGALAFGHGANDSQKAMGVIAALLLASGETTSLSVPMWARLGSAVALTVGTALGGWRIVKTIGRRLYRIRPVDGLASSAGSAAVIFGASAVGGPVSTTQVVASSVVGIGIGRRRFRHIRWQIVQEMGIAWLTTMPAAAVIAIAVLPLWSALP